MASMHFIWGDTAVITGCVDHPSHTELCSSHTIFTMDFDPDPSQQPSRHPYVCNCTVPAVPKQSVLP